MKPFQDKFSCIASEPIVEVTLGVPHCIASNNLPFKPAPKRIGARTTLDFFIISFASTALPMIKNPFLG